MSPSAVAIGLILWLTAPAVGSNPGGDEWKYDVVHLKSGEVVSGLVVERDAKHVFIRKIIRRPARPHSYLLRRR